MIPKWKRAAVLLIVDDEPVNISIIGKLFKHELEVLAATNGEEALEIAEKCSPDLVLLDVMMPDMDGYEVCRRLRKSEATKHIPIIFLTAKRDAGDEAFGLNLGAIDYIVKPFDLAIVRARVRNHINLKQMADVLGALAAQDGLTGIANRRQFDEVLGREWRRAMRGKAPLSLIILDVDSFKQFNDHYGHGRGDKCLKQVAATLQGVLNRPGDLAARIGGDEFAIIIPGSDAAGAALIAERARAGVEALGIANEQSELSDHVTVSVGCATLVPEQGGLSELLFDRADSALYRAKDQGRNRVVSCRG